MSFNNRETALILAGLRALQEQMINGGTRDLSAGVLVILDDAEVGEGAIDDIDSLCEKVNGYPDTRGLIEELLRAAELNHDDMEPETIALVERAEKAAKAMA